MHIVFIFGKKKRATVGEKLLNEDRHISCSGNTTLFNNKINIFQSSERLQEKGTTQNLIASSVLKLWLLRRA